MKKIYDVWIEQHYTIYQQWRYGKKRKNENNIIDKGKSAIIFAENEETAIALYKERYKIDYEKPFDIFWDWSISNAHYDNLVNEVKARETKGYTFNQLKEEMVSDDFLDYCVQCLYPVNVLLEQ